MPAFKPPDFYRHSPYLGGKGPPRDILAFMKGDMGQHREKHYSRGIRQALFNLSRTHNWKEKHNIVMGHYDDVPGEYGELLARSMFCVLAPGGCCAVAWPAALAGFSCCAR